MEASVAQSWRVSYAPSRRWLVYLFPSLTDFAFLLPFFLLFAMLPGAAMLLSDGDTGWHIRTGEWILQHRAVPSEDIFSFSKPHQPWFAWEWGWDVAMAAIHRLAGLEGLVIVNAVLLGLMAALLFRLIRRCSDNDLIAAAFTLLAVCASMMHWLARPHLVSWIFILIFSHAIFSAEKGNNKGLYWLPLLMLVWTNLHGGFFIGIVLLLTSAFAEIAKAVVAGENVWRKAYANSRPYLVSGVGCLAVSFINPYAWHLHRHVLSYLRDSKLLDNIQEFQSINFHRPSSLFIEIVLVAGIAAAFFCLRSGRVAAGLSVLLWAHLALVSSRNAPIFVLIATPWVAVLALDFAGRLGRAPWLRKLGSAVSEICDEFRPLERIERSHLVSVAAVVWVACLISAGHPGFEAQFNPKNFPITKVPGLRDVARSRLFTSDQWGDYLLYRFYPSERVFMDGRSDFYGDRFVTVYQHIMSAQYDWQADLKRFAIDTVMVKPDAPIAAVLKQTPGWKTVFDNGSVIVFRAQPDQRFNAAAAGKSAEITESAQKRLGISPNSKVDDPDSTLKSDERRSL